MIVENANVYWNSVGTVYLVGAGPGDPDLITVKGLNALRRADVVLYDALANPELLNEAPIYAHRIHVGKRSGHHTMPQEEINRLLAELAQQYAVVVRLKGGDPFIFGRGGEEMVYLRAAGVPVEIIPGISSALSMGAAVGVPLTHRKLSRSFAVITGHARNDATSDPPWKALSEMDTLVILMGLGNIRHITRQLMDAGRAAETPAMALSRSTLSDQRSITATLATLAEQVENTDLPGPAILVVGPVVDLAYLNEWFPLGMEGTHQLLAHEDVRFL